MLIAGAKRHAKEILELFHQRNELDNLCFFDDISNDVGILVFGRFPVIKTLEAVHEYFINNPKFVLGLGTPELRKLLSDKLILRGGKLVSILAKSASVGHYEVNLGEGLNIMQNAMISNNVSIGKGTLINAFVSVHHDVIIGEFCDISPHASLLGACQIGAFTVIGSNATILPDVVIGQHVAIGAGAVVTKSIPDNAVAMGIPARIVRYI
jgi:sugar O-acyltransferase (sialic acid O-acetyltransferase NeuD family)